MDRDWTASFSIWFRNGTCIIILDKKYNIANSSCHFKSYGSIWTGPYTAIWPSVPWTICYILGFITLLNIWAIVFSLNHLQCILHYYSLLWKQWFIWNQTFYKCSVCDPMQVYVFVMLTLKSKMATNLIKLDVCCIFFLFLPHI